MVADRDDLISLCHVDLCNAHLDAKYRRGEWNVEMFLDHGEEAANLFGLAIGIYRCFFDHALERLLAELRRSARCRFSPGSPLRWIHSALNVLIISHPRLVVRA